MSSSCRIRPMVIATVWIVAVSWINVASAQNTNTLTSRYSQALSTYHAGNFSAAITKLEEIAAIPLVHEHLFYALGCAYYRNNNLGRAIYAFERALQVAPGFEDARFNLKQARKRANARAKDILKGDQGEVWWYRLARSHLLVRWREIVVGLSWLLMAVIISRYYLRSRPLRAVCTTIISLGAVLLIAISALGFTRYSLSTRHEGIILPREVSAREGPDISGRTTFTMHSGLRVQITKVSADWYRIRLRNGLAGWIKQEYIGELYSATQLY